MGELRHEITQAALALCAKVRSSIMENRPEDAVHFAEALHEVCWSLECLERAND